MWKNTEVADFLDFFRVVVIFIGNRMSEVWCRDVGGQIYIG